MTALLSVLLAALALVPDTPSGSQGDSHAVALAARWRDHVLPTPDETGWERIPWIPSFAGGVLAAQEAQKPLLLWVMNGHPLGCT